MVTTKTRNQRALKTEWDADCNEKTLKNARRRTWGIRKELSLPKSLADELARVAKERRVSQSLIVAEVLAEKFGLDYTG